MPSKYDLEMAFNAGARDGWEGAPSHFRSSYIDAERKAYDRGRKVGERERRSARLRDNASYNVANAFGLLK